MTSAVFLGLGSNLGDRLQQLNLALEALNASPGLKLRKASSVYETPPWGHVEQARFLNLAAEFECDLPPLALLALSKSIEQQLGRQPTERWGPRAIDIDILVYGDIQLHSDQLTLPHKHLAERSFVLFPLAELARDLVIPGQTRNIEQLKADLPDSDIQPIA